MADSPDFLDGMLDRWAEEVPGLDAASLGVSARILRLANYLEKRTDAALAPLGITLWQLDVLAALYQAPSRDGLHVNELLPAALLSPPAMTNRIDRLEQAGFVERLADPADRRATRIRLTRAGRSIARRALSARGRESSAALAALSPREAADLSRLLRRLLQSLCERECGENSPQRSGE